MFLSLSSVIFNVQFTITKSLFRVLIHFLKCHYNCSIHFPFTGEPNTLMFLLSRNAKIRSPMYKMSSHGRLLLLENFLMSVAPSCYAVGERVFLANSVLPPFGGAGPILVGPVVRQSRPLSFNVQGRADPCALLAPVSIPVRVDRHSSSCPSGT